MKLKGKYVLITGAARRVGRQIAIHLARQGAGMILHYRESRKEALTLKRQIESLRAPAFLAPADFEAGQGEMAGIIREFSRQVLKQVPRVDVLVNNAADFYPTPFGKISEKDWDHFLTVNLKAPVFLAQEFGARMLKQKSGKIINLVDWTAARPAKNYLPYAISKAGLVTATHALAKELAPHVQVLGVALGPILPVEGSSKTEQRRVSGRTLLQRFGDPRDIAETVRFLIEGTDFMTGAVIPVEGGASLAS